MNAAGGGEAAPLGVGEVLAGKYRIEGVLGRGGMGVVFSATHLQLRQRVAIKVLNPGASSEVVERFLREARATARLRSEHVTRVIDVGQLPTGSPFLVMEHLVGSDLARTLAERGPLPVTEAVGYVLHACEAIAEAHAAGIVHRDLKPANLFLTTGLDGAGLVKVLDFGVSKELGDALGLAPKMELTRTAAMLGSPLYMAPEQMKSAKSADARADIWSLGIILYELLTQRIPFEAESLPMLVLAINGDPPIAPGKYRPDVPPGLAAAILRCLEKDPVQRFGDVGELARAIAPFGPPQAQALVERASRMLGTAPGGDQASRTAPTVPNPARAATSTATALAVGLATTDPVPEDGAPEAARRARGPWVTVIGVAAALVLGAIAAVGWIAARAPEEAALGADSASSETATTATVLPREASEIATATASPAVTAATATATSISAAPSVIAAATASATSTPAVGAHRPAGPRPAAKPTAKTAVTPAEVPPPPRPPDRNPLDVDIK